MAGAKKKSAKETAAAAAAAKQQQKKGAIQNAKPKSKADEARDQLVKWSKDKVLNKTQKAINALTDDELLALLAEHQQELDTRKTLQVEMKTLRESKEPGPALSTALRSLIGDQVDQMLDDETVESKALLEPLAMLRVAVAADAAAASSAPKTTSGGVQQATPSSSVDFSAIAAGVANDIHANGQKVRAAVQWFNDHVQSLVRTEMTGGKISGFAITSKVLKAFLAMSNQNGEDEIVREGLKQLYVAYRGRQGYRDVIQEFDGVVSSFSGTAPNQDGFYPTIPALSTYMRRFIACVISTVALCRLAADFHQEFQEHETVFTTVCRVLLSTTDGERRPHLVLLGDHVHKVKSTETDDLVIPECFKKKSESAPARTTGAPASSTTQKTFEFPCGKCGQKGHFRKNCPMQKRPWQHDGSKSAQQARAQPVVPPPTGTRK